MRNVSNNKDTVITFRLTHKEVEKLDSMCQQTGMQRSQLIRHCLSNEQIIVVKSGKYLVKQIMRLGNNLNQVARNLNTYHDVNLEHEFKEIEQQIQEAKMTLLQLEDECKFK